MKTEILKLLREQDGYLSGQQICETLGVSRTAVWKVMNQLKEEGYQIEAVPNKGYHLLQTPDILSVSEIESRLTTDHMARKLYYYDVTDSTNTDCKRYMEEEGVHGTLVVADMQRAGKGRRGRSWESPSGHAIFMSLGLKPEISPNKASMLTLVMALAVCDGIAGVTGQETGIKWPNDVVLHQKKICGILTEMSAEPDYINQVNIRVGINVNQT